MPRNEKFLVRSERNDRESQGRSHGEHAGRAPNQAVGRRPRDPGSGVDSRSPIVRLLVEPTSSRPLDLDQAAMAGDRPGGRKALNTVKERTKRPTRRVEDPDTSTSSSPLPDIPLPSPYDGRPDQRAFDAWAYEVTVYVKHYKLSDDQVMCIFHHLVSGNALSCFMTYFTPSRYPPSREWSLKEVFKVLQKECFPPDHKMTLHKQLMSATQGNLSVKGFVSELRFRARHLPYVSEQCLAAIFFVGVHKYIRIRLIRDGMGQDDTDLETLKEHAQRYECARRMLQDYRYVKSRAYDPRFPL